MANREKLKAWMKASCATAKSTAELLSEKTGDKISDKTVERWLADPSKTYARRCPGWIDIVLKFNNG